MVRQSDWRLIECLYRNKSLTKTAGELYMTQPAVTKRLQQLEKEFGIKIATRSTRGLIFTPKGEYIAQYAIHAMHEYKIMTENLLDQKESVAGTLHLSACSSLTRSLLPDLLGSYKKAFPKVNFKLSTDFSFKVSQIVHTKNAHVGFLRGEHITGCQKSLICRQRTSVICAYPFTLEELPALPRIDFYADQFASQSIDAWWYENYDTPPNIAMMVNSGSTCVELVRNGLGYAICLSSDMIRGTDGLYQIFLTKNNGELPLIRNDWMVYHKDFLELALVASFVEYARSYFQNNQ